VPRTKPYGCRFGSVSRLLNARADSCRGEDGVIADWGPKVSGAYGGILALPDGQVLSPVPASPRRLVSGPFACILQTGWSVHVLEKPAITRRMEPSGNQLGPASPGFGLHRFLQKAFTPPGLLHSSQAHSYPESSCTLSSPKAIFPLRLLHGTHFPRSRRSLFRAVETPRHPHSLPLTPRFSSYHSPSRPHSLVIIRGTVHTHLHSHSRVEVIRPLPPPPVPNPPPHLPAEART